MLDLIIKGRVVTPSGTLDDGWVGVAGQTIAEIGTGPCPSATTVDDAGQAYILPGIIDGQTHAGSQFGFRGLEATTRSAVAGGVTTIVDMPYDDPEPVASGPVLAQKIAAVEEHAYGDVALYGTISPTLNTDDIHALIAGGVCAFKISSFENHPTRFPRIGNDTTLDLLELLAETDIPLGLHNEDQEIVRSRLARLTEAGRHHMRDHSPSRPEVAELVATATFLELGAATGAHVHIVHISTPRGFELVRHYQARGVRATAEMCVHYLHFDAAEDADRLGALMKVNPPIRDNVREQLWKEVGDTAVSLVSSDHSAWPLARKQSASVHDNAAGIPGLETLLPAFFSGAEKRGLDAAAHCARHLSEGPAKLFGLWPRKGGLIPGGDADITVFAPEPWTFSTGDALDGLGWSPFDGEPFSGRAVATYVRGTKVWDGTKVIGAPGHGQFIPRAPGPHRSPVAG
ncbi:dihydroorotase [Pelagibacterium lacus]|uniref:Dihydroorotase n=1 Tax=Pelagibacterium lacus TaxID=2282655 RepID=A0A369W4R5_9HYPH|nr:amidohydrolase family protein [Pelagibacterium lacus]RDE09548.1 dihydroorotase [Pelagibacterium lacus]